MPPSGAALLIIGKFDYSEYRLEITVPDDGFIFSVDLIKKFHGDAHHYVFNRVGSSARYSCTRDGNDIDCDNPTMSDEGYDTFPQLLVHQKF